jgi:hypothetical protein
MTPRLTNAFKKQVADVMLKTSKQLIATNFDKKNDNYDKNNNKTINIVTDNQVIDISRNCFGKNDTKPYYEDYQVCFTTVIENELVDSVFYLEWINNDLLPTSEIKVKKCRPFKHLRVVRCA